MSRLFSTISPLCWLIIINSINALSYANTCKSNNNGYESPFVDEVTNWLDTQNVNWKPRKLKGSGRSRLLSLTTQEKNHNSSLFLHLLPAPRSRNECYGSTFTRQITEEEKREEDSIIHLHEDVWESKQEIVKDRLGMRMGRIIKSNNKDKTKRIFARKTNVRRINSILASSFLERNHLWSSTKAKYSYGLFYSTSSKRGKDGAAEGDDEELLVAVATFSSRRKVLRNGIPFRSHELLRFCCQSDGVVIGGLSKLVKAFCRDVNPDDLVTVIDRDWGVGGDGWHKLGFETVQLMPPLVMAIRHNQSGGSQRKIQRHHLIGAGIITPPTSSNDNSTLTNNNGTNLIDSIGNNQQQERWGLPANILEALNRTKEEPNNNDAANTIAINYLMDNDYYPVYDVGVERLFMIVNKTKQPEAAMTNKELWEKSVPTYSSDYYSTNSGIAAILRSIEEKVGYNAYINKISKQN